METRLVRTLLPATAALAILAGCGGGGSKNKNNGANNAAATSAATVVPTTIAAAGTATKAPVTNGSALAPTGGQRDDALQSALDKALLTETDLPAGYSKLDFGAGNGLTGNLAQPGETASAGSIFLKAGAGTTANPLAGNIIIDALGGFKDAAVAKAGFKDLRSQASALGADTKIESVSGGPKLGDEAETFKITSTGGSTGFTGAGYVVAWRRGRLGGIVGLIGNPGPKSVDEITPAAIKQDDRLKTVKQ